MNASSKMRRGLVVGVCAAAVVGALAVFTQTTAAGRGQEGAAPVPSMTVSVLAPQPMSFERAIAATGTVSAKDELIIGSDASGVRLVDVLVDVGSPVRKGQLMARGDDAQLLAQLAQQVALVKQAEADHEQAAANLDRAERLKDSGVYSTETVQTRRTQAAAASAKLELAIAQRNELEIKIAHTRFVAPSDGVVSRRSATLGAVVQQGTELFRVIRDGQLEWRAELPGHSLAKIRAGSPVRILLDGGNAINATVRLVAPTIDTSTRNGLVYVALPAGSPLKSGGHARGEILVDNAHALAVPEAAVLTRDGYPFVYTVGPDGIARQTRIEAGARQRGQVEISAGLRPEARVVATGAGFIKDGDLVRIAPPTASAKPIGGQS